MNKRKMFKPVCANVDFYSGFVYSMLGEDLIDACIARRDELVPKHIIIDDIFASVNYMNGLALGLSGKDDIDHLGNRRLRCVGELLQNQFRIGFSRMDTDRDCQSFGRRIHARHSAFRLDGSLG